MKHTFKPLLWAFSCLLSLSPFLGAQAQTPCSDRLMKDINFVNVNDPSADRWDYASTDAQSNGFSLDVANYEYVATGNTQNIKIGNTGSKNSRNKSRKNKNSSSRRRNNK